MARRGAHAGPPPPGSLRREARRPCSRAAAHRRQRFACAARLGWAWVSDQAARQSPILSARRRVSAIATGPALALPDSPMSAHTLRLTDRNRGEGGTALVGKWCLPCEHPRDACCTVLRVWGLAHCGSVGSSVQRPTPPAPFIRAPLCRYRPSTCIGARAHKAGRHFGARLLSAQ